MPRTNLIKVRRGTAAQWASADPTLASGELGYETDTNLLKIGDGTTAYSSLSPLGPESFSWGETDTLLTTVDGSNLSATHKITRSATIVIAASNSSDESKDQADIVCDGTADDVEIKNALNTLQNGGSILLLEGNYDISSSFLVDADSSRNITLMGTGKNTVLVGGFAGSVFNFQDLNVHWILRDFVIDCIHVGTHGIYSDGATTVGNRDIRLQNIIIRYATSACIEIKDQDVDGFYLENCDLWGHNGAPCLKLTESQPCNYFNNVTFFVSTGGTGVESIGGSGYFSGCIFVNDGGLGSMAFYVNSITANKEANYGTSQIFTNCHFEPGTFVNTPIVFMNSTGDHHWSNVVIRDCWIGAGKNYCIEFYYTANTDDNLDSVFITGNVFKYTAAPAVAYINFGLNVLNPTVFANSYESKTTPIYAGSPIRALIDVPSTSGKRLNYVNGAVVSPIISWGGVPATSTSTGYPGQIAYDSDYLYICVAENTWMRTQLGWT